MSRKVESRARLLVDAKRSTFEVVGCVTPLQRRANQFLEALRTRGLAVLSIRAYGFDLVHLLRWLEARGYRFKAVNQAHLLEWIVAQRNQNAEPTSINRRLCTAHVFYRFCFDQEIKRVSGACLPSRYYKGRGYDSIGVHYIGKPKSVQMKVRTAKKLIVSLEPKDVQSFLGTLTRYRDMVAVLLMLLCGFRSCEVLALRLDDVNFYDKSIRVRGKGGKERNLPLVDELADLIRKYLRYERPIGCKEYRLLVVLQGPRRGEALTAAGLRNLFRCRRRRLNLNLANPHRFRHCFGTDMARQGVQLPVLQKMLGHADTRVTLRYIQLSMADVATEYAKAIRAIQSRYDES